MEKLKTKTAKGVLAIIALTATIALANVLARYLDDGFTVLQQVYLRIFIALLLALVIFYGKLRWKKIAKLPVKEWLLLAFRGLTGYAIGVVLMTQAVQMTTVGNVTLIAALPLVPLFGMLFLGEKATWWKFLFIAGSLFGVALLATNGPSDLLAWNAGDLVAVAATIGLALNYIARKWHGPTLNNQEITTLTFVFGMIFVLLLSFVFFGEGVPDMTNLSLPLWLALIGAGATSMVKLFLTNYGFQYVDAVRGGNLLTLEGAWGILFGLLFFAEIPTWHGIVGGFVIVAAVIGMNIMMRRATAKTPAPPEGHLPER